jgi:hypothetical protein
MYCYELQKKCVILCVVIVLTRLCYMLLLSGYLENVLIVQPLLQKKVLFVLLMKKTPRPNNLELASETSLKENSCLCWYFLALECFTLEIKPAQLIDTHSSTPKSTKASLCPCVCQKNGLLSVHANHI